MAPALAASSACRQRLAGFQAVQRQGQLDADVVGDFCQNGSFAHHAFIIGRGDFGGNRAVNHGTDFLRDLHDVAAGFQNQGRVGCDAIHEAQFIQFADFIYIRCIDKKFHPVPCLF